MESFTHESDNSSSCTQSDGDSTNSSNGTNPFLLCPRGDSLHLSNHGRLHDDTEDIRPYKLARIEPSGKLHYRASALANSERVTAMPYAHNVIGGIHGPDGMHRSAMLPQGRSYTSSALEDCRGLPVEFAAAARSQHAGLPYIGATQNFFAQNQWPGLRQQNFVFKPIATGSTPASTLLLPLNCKVDQMPINFGNNAGNFYLGLTDPQPGRCRRTDGKKWRCGRAVVPEQKYCERHMHRGRGRSKAAKLAKVTTTAETHQPHDSGRPLNQPLIQLLSQLTVPVEPANQPPKAEQQPTGAVQPLKWLQKSAQTCQLPHSQLPYLAQPLLAEQLSQFPIQSKPFDWPVNQLPMQAEPLNLGQSNGRPPLLAQAIPMNAVPEVKISPDCGSELPIIEASRMHSDDPNDVLNLDVQGIKRLLENAPCSRRSGSSLSKPKQLPNVADLLNVAHIGNMNIEPRKPSSLIDVLKMVDSSTSNSMRTSISSVFYGHSSMTSQGSVILPSNICQQGQDLPDLGNSGTPLSLTQSDDQTPEKQSKQYCNSPSSLDLVTVRRHNDMTSLKLFNATGEGRLNTHTLSECLQPLARSAHEGPLPNSTGACAIRAGSHTCHTSETSNGRQPELEGRKNSVETLVDSEKTYQNLMQEKSQRAGQLHKVFISTKDGNFESAAGSSFQVNSANVDIHSCTQSAGGFKDPRSLMMQENSPSLRKTTSNEHTASPKSDSGSLILIEESLDVCDVSGKSEGFCPSLTEKSLDKHVGADSPDIDSLVSMKERVLQRGSYANLDMNIPILVVKDDRLQGKREPTKAISSSKPFIETLQTKAALDRSSSGSSCNVSSFSKSTSSFDPPAVSNPEPLSPISLAN